MRLEVRPGHKVLSMELYDDYLDWCKAEEVSRNDIVTLAAFGRMLSASGIANCKGRDGRMSRRGIALRA